MAKESAPSTPSGTSPATSLSGRPRWRVVGPGLIAAATGVGAGDLVATLVAGSRFGYALLWAAVLGCVLKIILVESTGRWYLASGRTLFQGWHSLGRWTTVYFGIYVVIWGFVYGATAMSSTALPLAALFPAVDLKIFAILSGLLGLAFVWYGNYAFFERLIAVLVGLMFLAVVGSAVVAAPNLGQIADGMVPHLPPGSLFYVLGLAGGVGGTITLAAYGYWLREKGWRQPRWMAVMRIDNTMAYVMTGIFVVSMLIVGAELLYTANIALTGGGRGLIDLADVLGERYGRTWAVIFLIGFWATSFSSLIGVWNGVSLMFADFVAHLGRPIGEEIVEAPGLRSKQARAYMLWLTFPPILLLFLDEPFLLIVGYGVLGSLFMPFLAVTLLFLMNSKELDPRWRNGPLSNLLLGATCALFLVLGMNELWSALRPLFG